jgi:hypothetical protein
MARVAVLVDLGFFLPRYRSLIQMDGSPPHTPKKVARNLWRTALGHVDRPAAPAAAKTEGPQTWAVIKKATNGFRLRGTRTGKE